MNRNELLTFIAETYSAREEHLWADTPEAAVFRHDSSKKWFALIMCIPKSRLGIPQDGSADILNIKCEPLLIDSLIGQEGFYPAYHMNKKHWITVALSEAKDDAKIRQLLDMSYDLTDIKKPRFRKRKL